MGSPTEKTLIATIEVLGNPVAQPKHAQVAMPVASTRCRCGCYRKWRAMAYPVKTIGEGHKKRPHPILAWRRAIVLAAKCDCDIRGIGFAVRVEREFRFDRPAGHWGTGRNAGTLKPSAPAFHIVKPDGDNLTKPVFDSLKDAGIIRDDCIIVRGEPHKRYCNPGESPGCTITIWKLEY